MNKFVTKPEKNCLSFVSLIVGVITADKKLSVELLIYILGNNDDNILRGGIGDDSIFGVVDADNLIVNAGDDTLVGSASKDIFVYAKSTGNDTITDYTADEDKIKLSAGKISAYSYSENDFIFGIGKGKTVTSELTVRDAAGKEITIIDTTGKTITQVYTESADSYPLLECEDNFVTSSDSSAIVKNNAIAGEF